MFTKLTNKLLESTDGSNINQYLAVCTSSIGFFTSGLYSGWITPSLPKLLSNDYYSISDDEAASIAMIGNIGHIIGCFLFAYLNDIIGRKKTILATCIPQILGFLLTYCYVYGKGWLYLARILGGIADGGVIPLTGNYCSEITDSKIRGTCGTIHCIFWPIGYICIVLVGSYLDIQTTALLCLTFPLLSLLTFSLMPETPYYLLMKNKFQEAERSLKILRRTSTVEKELCSLTLDVDRQMSETGTYKDLFTIPANYKAFLLVILMRIYQQFSGATTISNYSQLLIQQTTNFSPVLGSVIFQILSLVMYIPAYFLIENMGRKFLMQLSGTLTCIVLMLLGTFFLVVDYFPINTSNLDWIPLVLIACYLCAHGVGLSIIVSIYISEIFSSSIKSKALGLTGIILSVTVMGAIKVYQFTADNFSKAVPFYLFGIITFISIILSHRYLPETKGKTLETIQQELKKM